MIQVNIKANTKQETGKRERRMCKCKEKRRELEEKKNNSRRSLWATAVSLYEIYIKSENFVTYCQGVSYEKLEVHGFDVK